MSFATLFDQIPVGHSTANHWASQPTVILDEVAAVLEAHGVNPWVFSADERHFWEFAGPAELAALNAISAAQFYAVFGNWDEI